MARACYPTIGDLPDDILIILFLFSHQLACAQESEAIWTPIRLSHVCSRWRSIALDIAQLWTAISFGKKYNSVAEPQVEFARQAEWVRRSKGASLDIRILPVPWDFDVVRMDAGKAMLRWVADLLKPHAHRWRSLILESRVSRTIPMEHFFQHIQTLDLPNLRILEMTPPDEYARWTVHSLQPGATPKLVRLVAPAGVDFEKPFIHSLRNLRHVEISIFNFSVDAIKGAEEIVTLLRLSPGLECFRIIGTLGRGLLHHDHPAEHALEVVAASQVVDFTIQSLGHQIAVFPFIRLPAFHGRDDWSVPREALPIIHTHNPFPNLQSISVYDTGFPLPYPVAEMPAMLSNLDALENVTFAAAYSGAQATDSEWVRGFANTCPKLRTMTLVWGLGLSENAIRAMVEGRKEWGKPLWTLTLILREGSDISSDLISWLQDNVAEVIIDEDLTCSSRSVPSMVDLQSGIDPFR